MATVVFVSQHKEILTRAPRFRVAYQAPHVVAGDKTHAVAGDGSNAVAADRRARACATAAAIRAQRRGLVPLRTAPRVPHAGGEKKYKVSTRPPATFPLSPRVLKCPFSLPALNAQLTSSAVLLTIFRVCGNGDYGVCYVSQHEEISTRAPRFCVGYQAPHAVAGDGTHAVAAEVPHAVAVEAPHAVAVDGSHAVAAAAARRARRRGPGPQRTAPRAPHAGGEKNTRVSPPLTP
jgi:hypothetical protein